MALEKLLNNRTFKGPVIVFLTGFICVFLVITLSGISLNNLIDYYVSLPKWLANGILESVGAGVVIEQNKIAFDTISHYVSSNEDILNNWKDYLLFKKWSAVLLVIIWFTLIPLFKKIIYTGVLILAHQTAILSGLLISTLVAPVLITPDSISELRPNFIGALIFISLSAVFVKKHFPEIQQTLGKLKINLNVRDRQLNEIIILFFIFSLLRNLIVPYINFYAYIDFLLHMTKWIVSWFGYDAVIDGPYLVGENGTLFMAKWCLGFITMFVFASLVYLTGQDNKTKWTYIAAGILFLHIVNIIRLAVLYVFVQNNDNYELALDHHDLYNIIVYAIIFILWVIWFEKYSDINLTVYKNKSISKQNP